MKVGRVERGLAAIGLAPPPELKKGKYTTWATGVFADEASRAEYGEEWKAAVRGAGEQGKKFRWRLALEDTKARKQKDAKRRREEGEKDGRAMKKTKTTREAVSPWADVPYPEQLVRKKRDMVNIARKYDRKAGHASSTITPLKMTIPVADITPSPLTQGYRNKLKFTLGRSTDGIPMAGHRLGGYTQGSIAVGPVADVPTVPTTAAKIAETTSGLLRTCESTYPVYSTDEKSGVWRYLIVRTSRNGGIMASFYVKDDQFDDQGRADLRALIVATFTAPDAAYLAEGNPPITSLYVCSFSEVGNEPAADAHHELLSGVPVLTETLLGLDFEISPASFFQVNTQGAELLYSLIGTFAAPSPDATVLDVCCGTGTIGLSVAPRVANVVGLELVEAAVEDAKRNAERNNIPNASFVAGKAEAQIKAQIAGLGNNPVVAIVDPPRSGLHPKVGKALRDARGIDRLVYVSCNPKAFVNESERLSAWSNSKAKMSPPFVPILCAPVDMFPHTAHTELVTLFRRVPERFYDNLNPKDFFDSPEYAEMQSEALALFADFQAAHPSAHPPTPPSVEAPAGPSTSSVVADADAVVEPAADADADANVATKADADAITE